MLDNSQKDGTKQRYSEFGNALWVLAASRGVTRQKELAEAVRISPDTLRNYLYGKTGAPRSFLQTLDRAFGFTVDEKMDLAYVYAWGELQSGRPV